LNRIVFTVHVHFGPLQKEAAKKFPQLQSFSNSFIVFSSLYCNLELCNSPLRKSIKVIWSFHTSLYLLSSKRTRLIRLLIISNSNDVLLRRGVTTYWRNGSSNALNLTRNTKANFDNNFVPIKQVKRRLSKRVIKVDQISLYRIKLYFFSYGCGVA
jgi:hypothetical protein